ncbi:MAG: PTS sugar transporter subunit IIA [Thermodesulfobacteriota bacterium]
MKLVVQDVATLLKVSEKVVHRWIAQRGLPAHRVNDQYRFNRTELLEWATANRVPISVAMLKEDRPGELPGLAEALEAGGIHYRVAGKDKLSLLTEVVRLMPLPQEVDRAFLLDVLVTRESLGSTGIGNGVAIPHIRNPIVLHIPRPMISLCFLDDPVDFDAVDRQPVHTLFAIVSPTIRGHLHLLSRLSFALSQPAFKEAVARPALREEVLRRAGEVDRMIETAPDARG